MAVDIEKLKSIEARLKAIAAGSVPNYVLVKEGPGMMLEIIRAQIQLQQQLDEVNR